MLIDILWPVASRLAINVIELADDRLVITAAAHKKVRVVPIANNPQRASTVITVVNQSIYLVPATPST